MYAPDEPNKTTSPPTGAFSGLLAAAQAGQFAVDPAGGEAIIHAIKQIQDILNRMSESIPSIDVRTPLGGGYAEIIGQLNQKFAAGDDASAQAILLRFREVLEQDRAAVEISMRSYQEMEGAAATQFRTTGR